ncbi:diguanylate cyclase (GGDEF)-like protein [Litorivivens lipolytica]|uniref:diguanylate cyclase n=1 Tax=Litorivivens lipolytica TaxID=1524264 RepID=A0A7W4Z6Y2_9GAMM|nr:diguanylate cyclase [Litorivivens lipolytica]MBB3048707.1 diguanylate cyclase (GGDEF)-like protein [Litorivivens lipolytica]
MKVLIAEDDLTSRIMLENIISRSGFTPISVTDGASALKAWRQDRSISIVVTDLNMPFFSGIELCATMRQESPDRGMYSIVVTAQDKPGILIEALDAGASDFVYKPYNPAELIARLNVARRHMELHDKLEVTKEQLKHQATHDSLTGALNRRAIMAALDEDISRAERNNRHLAVAMIDIDDFKGINDTHGHTAGDQVIRYVSSTISECIRPYDHMGRYGGEEFLVIAEVESHDDASLLFRRICRQIADGDERRSRRVTVSGGVTLVPPTARSRSADNIINAADSLLYQAKRSGKNRILSDKEWTAQASA